MACLARAADIDPPAEAAPTAGRVLIFARAANDNAPRAADLTTGATQVQQETTPLASGTITYAYDPLGRMASRTVAGSGAETFQFDAIGRLITHASDLGSFTLSYLGQTGQITGRQLAGSTLATSWGYLTNTGDRRLASVGTVGPVSGQSTSFQYTTNAADLTTGTTQTSDAAIPYPPGALAQTATYNDLNQLTAFTNPNPPPTNRHPTFDLDGNMLTNGTRVFSWDGENRLIGITYPGQPGKATAFAYDGLGRRAAITSTPASGPAVATSYIWCGDRPCQARDSADAVTRGYYAEGEFTPGTPAQADYYAPDQIGSARRVFTASSAPTYDYDPYGNALQATAPVTDFNYAGMFYNTDSGLYLTQYRAYDPTVGRWLSRDPIGEGGDPQGNLYGYVGGEPVGATDPSGLIFTLGPIPIRQLLGGALCFTIEHPTTVLFVAEVGLVAIVLAPETGGASLVFGAGAGELALGLEEDTALSTLRYTEEGESFIRYESGDPAFSRITSNGGLQPGTFAASASEGVQSQSSLNDLYNLPNPEISRGVYFEINPPGGTLVIGPRPVIGGIGAEVTFPSGVGPGSVGPETPTPP